MILKALYDYYNRCGNLPAPGMEEKEIGFVIVISKEGKFLRFEDCRTDKTIGRVYLVKKHVSRSSAAVANYLYDNSAYVLGYSDKDDSEKNQLYFNTFVEKVQSILDRMPDNSDIRTLMNFYAQGREAIHSEVEQDPLWEDIKKNLSKKYSVFSFRIEGDLRILAEKKELMQTNEGTKNDNSRGLCMVTGVQGELVDTTTATMIQGSQATAKLVAFQVNSGYDSYGKEKCGNAPISHEAEFAYTTALNTMLRRDSRNKFTVGNRTFVFWASSNDKAAEQAEESLFDLLGYSEEKKDNPNAKIEQVRKVFTAIYSGSLSTSLEDRFYILGLAPNSARIAVVYWSETPLRDFAGKILRHFDDMEIIDTRKDRKPYMGIKDILSAVTLGGKQSEATPNLPESIIKSIFLGTPYPYTLLSACIRRIRAESGDGNAARITRIAIIKAFLNRQNVNDKRMEIMLDKRNTNQGYLCGRLFAVLDRIQEDANGISSIRERYMNAASSTPSSVFATILNLSSHHLENLSNEGKKVFYEKLKQEIIDKISSDGFPAHLDLQDQGRFFVGYYHQRQDFFNKKEENNNDESVNA
jgi:CRISPR-associated protein Csd1|uniref:type I-C CRISPR-associated protein Cas8c/Csd1 n=1 Tax=Candidatus Cryptobacteroides bacterium TaxID=3085639 RepID=UPI0040298484